MPALTSLTFLGGRQVEEDDEGNASGSRILLAKADTRALSEMQVLALLPSPYIVGYPHPDNAFLFVNRRAAVQDPTASAAWWTITISYSNKKANQTDNPLRAPAEITVDTLIEEREVWKDRHGQAICNKAGDPIEGVKKRVRYAEFTIYKNLWPLPNWLLQIQGAINQSAYTIYPTGDPIGFPVPAEYSQIEYFKPGKPKKLNGVWYFEAEMKIIAKGERIVHTELNRGFRHLPGPGFTIPVPIPGLSEPALLDNAGKKIDDPSPANATFIDVELDPLFDFNTLGIFI